MPRNPFAGFDVVAGTLYRPPAMSGMPPTRGLPALVGPLKLSPFAPLTAAVLARTPFERPHELKQTYTSTPVVEGDSIVRTDDGLTYTVVSVSENDWRPGALSRYEVILRQPRAH